MISIGFGYECDMILLWYSSDIRIIIMLAFRILIVYGCIINALRFKYDAIIIVLSNYIDLFMIVLICY